ncbi:acyltransferase [Acinetobacter junii]|uniref:acyltransferase n=1 Tax=Acinetobacter junii TaxID=40215 RepID=UPI003212FF32
MITLLKKMIATLHFYSSKAWVKLLIFCYSAMFQKIGNNVIFNPVNSVFTYANIQLGNHIFIGGKAWFSGEINIGNYVMFGPGVTILGGDHEYKNLEKPMFFVKDNAGRSSAVHIEDDVWVGANVTILKGVRIKRGAIVAAGSLVNKDVEEFEIVGGVPAKILTQRFNAEDKQIYLSNIMNWEQQNER